MPKSFLLSLLVVLILAGVLLVPRIKKPDKTAATYFLSTDSGFCINTVCLTPKDSLWWVKVGNSQAPADSDKVEAVRKSLQSIVLTTVVSRNSDRASELGFPQSNGVVVTVNGKKLELGDVGPDYASTFVRVPGSTVVYSVPTIMSKEDWSNENSWLNRRITNWPLYQIKKINSVTPDKDGKWTNDKWVEAVVHLNAVSYDPGQYNTSQAKKFEVVMDNGQGTLWAGQSGTGKKAVYWATTDQKVFYQIKKEDFDLLTSTQ
ncbi:DUF4340 domain-containing protein [Patescibacteria group bacterium]|nr:DUF4340 domain-containing protein [Patescibacteria group bacterium]